MKSKEMIDLIYLCSTNYTIFAYYYIAFLLLNKAVHIYIVIDAVTRCLATFYVL